VPTHLTGGSRTTTAQKTCVCDAPFFGAQCEQFTLYSYSAAQGGLQMPLGNTSWGGSVVQVGSRFLFSWWLRASLNM
jgi:uncharacterized glyoxalase superfamily protein PhnB